MPTVPTDHLAGFRGKHVLVTGGLGFIGSNLAHRLVDLGADVLIVDSLIPEYGGNVFNVHTIEDRLRVNIADMRDEHGLRYLVQEQDIIFNLAGQVSHTDSMIDPYTDLEINARSQLSLLEACRHGNPAAKIIFASTRQIYGRPTYLPVDERHPLQPTDVNGINKLAGEWYHIVYHNVYGLRAVSLRLTNTFGPRMRIRDARQTFIGWWIRQLLEGQTLHIFGDGLQVRDFNYVDDVVEAMLMAAAHDVADGQIYNLGGDEPINLINLARLMIEVNGGGDFALKPFPDDRKRIDIGDFYGDYRKIRSKLGWRPQVGLREGLTRTIEFFRTHREHYL
ncbi:MAG: NAD-dependent epimerase/dehydratase family protein [Anaerolineales bacterium]|uniref:NAD-dependent epimerase/dehydratase family protein n=1 Tax=Promineifilum sp. TaxID=2664178 RepID=UPI001D573298|nr:NAD-dependent epimerase/dehydratase family protein [Anaerolineales bacterium]MCB8934591.1 NAD-dependent epimerase/dehydratase family protein [Promineifilum sp.]MCO5180891.1 GDP-mannose 4,6-dehydratase [Promineifilum sp.]